MLGKFTDLPHEAEEEIRGLDEARRRIAELERQINRLKGSSTAPQIDHMAVDRAAKAATSGNEQHGSGNWSGQGTLPSDGYGGGAVSVENSEGPLKLSSGGRRILSALAQSPEGRSKVQVAVLTGHAAAGGGFNNYLGALRSRKLLEGDGDRLMITEAGIQALGSWEPLPAGRALIDYWRSRLGKAERLIIETLTQAYPAAFSKEEIAAQAGYEANGGGFNNALGRLRMPELVQGRGDLKASDNLFDFGVI